MADEKPSSRAVEATEMYAARIPLADIQKHFNLPTRQALWDLLMSLPPEEFPKAPSKPSDLDTFRAMLERAGIGYQQHSEKDGIRVKGARWSALFGPLGNLLLLDA